jgi:predicted RNA-binding protein with RPS1 domain
MFPDHETPGSEPSGAPAVAAARAPEPEAPAVAEQGSTAEPEAGDQGSNHPAAHDVVSAANGSSTGSANLSDSRSLEDSASLPESTPSEATAAAEETSAPSNEELNQLMDQYAAPQQAPTEGEIVEGRVVAIADVGAVVDIGGKTEALIPAGEFMEADQPIRLDPGQNIEVQLTGEHKDGYLVVSYQRARRRRVWANLDKAYHDKSTITGRIVDRVKGGLVVDVGVRAFLPASQVDLRPIHELEEWKDRDIDVRVLKLNRKRGNVVVSRRAILEDEQKLQRQKLMDHRRPDFPRLRQEHHQLRCVRRYRRDRWPLARVGPFMGACRQSRRRGSTRRRTGRTGAQVRSRKDARIAGATPIAAGSLVVSTGAISRGGAGAGPRRRHRRLWRLCGIRFGR